MAAEQMIMSHRGKSVAPLVSMPKASAMPKSPMDMNFCPSWAPWRNDSAQAQMSCSTMHTLLPRWPVDAGEEKLDDLGGGHTEDEAAHQREHHAVDDEHPLGEHDAGKPVQRDGPAGDAGDERVGLAGGNAPEPTEDAPADGAYHGGYERE